MVRVIRVIGQALVAAWIFARRTTTGLLILLGALGVVSPVAGWAYVWLASGVNPLVYPEFWRTPVRSILTLMVVGLVFVPLELLGVVLEYSRTREHALFILLTVLGATLWVRGMVRLRRARDRRRLPTGKPGGS